MPERLMLLMKSEGWRGMVASFPIMLGVMPYGLVLGSQAAKNGFAWFQVPLMTGVNFAGASEFVAMKLWTSPPQLLLIAAMTFLVNSRHILMGAALAPYIQHLPKRKAFPALFFMTDESWAMTLDDIRQRQSATTAAPFSLRYYMGLSMSLYAGWVISTTTGAAIAPMIGDIEAYGFDMAFTAVFLVLLKGMWSGIRAARPWLVSLVVAALTYLAIPGVWYIATGALSGIVAAFIWAGKE